MGFAAKAQSRTWGHLNWAFMGSQASPRELSLAVSQILLLLIKVSCHANRSPRGPRQIGRGQCLAFWLSGGRTVEIPEAVSMEGWVFGTKV